MELPLSPERDDRAAGRSFFAARLHHPLRAAKRALRRFVRKHALALLLLAIVHVILFFPSLFMGRVLSPNDVYYNYDPWRSVRQVEAQNPIINDPPASYLTLASLLREDPDAFHWNRYIGSGIPGLGSVASAVLSPFIALPAVFLPLILFYSGVVFLKLTLGYWGAYLWLREERLGRRGAAIGALVFAAAGSYVVWWLWQATNNTALYGFALFILSRAARGRRTPLILTTIVVLGFLLSGFPATIIYFACVAILYAIVKLMRGRFVVRRWIELTAAAAAALAIAAPMLAAFVTFLRRTGYLEAREAAAQTVQVYPLAHLWAFFDPYRMGDPTAHLWRGAAKFISSDNFVETTVYLGVLAVPLVAIGAYAAARRGRFFWIVVLAVIVAVLFFTTPLSAIVSSIPGIRYSPLTRFRAILPLPAAWLAAAGCQLLARRSSVRGLLVTAAGVTLAIDLGVFAARYYPYQLPEVASIPVTETTSQLRSFHGPFRVAPMFDAYWPNTAELMRVEDIRSHFGSEERYRRIFQRIDPQSWGRSGTVLTLNSLESNLEDPFFAFLNARYVYEQPSIDILRWKTYEKSTPLEPAEGEMLLGGGSVVRRDVILPEEKVWALDVSASPRTADARIRVILRAGETGDILERVERNAMELRALNKIYLPIREPRHGGNHVIVEIEADGLVALPAAAGSQASRPVIALVKRPLIHISERRDGRLFENLAALPRYFAVWNVEAVSFDSLIALPQPDLRSTAYVENGVTDGALREVPRSRRRVTFTPRIYSASRQVVDVSSVAPFFFVSSEKVSPELELLIDGKVAKAVVTNGLFVGVPMPAGNHTVELRRRIGRGWWPFFWLGVVAFVAFAILDRRARKGVLSDGRLQSAA